MGVLNSYRAHPYAAGSVGRRGCGNDGMTGGSVFTCSEEQEETAKEIAAPKGGH
jgi:hypothetical protein